MVAENRCVYVIPCGIGLRFIGLGIKAGWTLESINKNDAEFVAVDKFGNIYGGEPGPRKLKKTKLNE